MRVAGCELRDGHYQKRDIEGAVLSTHDWPDALFLSPL